MEDALTLATFTELNTFCSGSVINTGGWKQLTPSSYSYVPHPVIYEDVLTLPGLTTNTNYIVSGYISEFTGITDAIVKVRFGINGSDVYTITKNDVGTTFSAYGYSVSSDTLNFIGYNDTTVKFIITSIRLSIPNTPVLVDKFGVPLTDASSATLVATVE